MQRDLNAEAALRLNIAQHKGYIMYADCVKNGATGSENAKNRTQLARDLTASCEKVIRASTNKTVDSQSDK